MKVVVVKVAGTGTDLCRKARMISLAEFNTRRSLTILRDTLCDIHSQEFFVQPAVGQPFILWLDGQEISLRPLLCSAYFGFEMERVAVGNTLSAAGLVSLLSFFILYQVFG